MKITRKVLILLVAVTLFLGGFSVIMSSINPGFEGAKCFFYGTYIGELGQGWTGDSQFHAYHEAEDPLAFFDPMPIDGAPSIYQEKLYWSNFATPNDAGMGWRIRDSEKPELKVHVENNVQLQDITRQGDPDPLDYNDLNPLEGRRIEYWSKKATKVIETEDTIHYEYELTKESFLIVPAEFWVGFYLTPSQSDAHTGSGWCEGEWGDLTAWFRLDFHVWDNAYYDDWMDDPQDEVFTTEYGGTVISQEKKVEPPGYRGGFPIAGWIQGWEQAGWTSAGIQSQSPLWYDIRGTESGVWTQEQLWDLRDILTSKTQFSPGMVGTSISLYDSPDQAFSYAPQFSSFDEPDQLTQEVKTPDSRLKKVMYFPINIENFGTYAEDQGWWGLTGWKVYYPSAYFRIRTIYGVYGTFKYLWTEEVTKPYPEGLDYPEDFERQGTTIIHTTGPLTPFANVMGGMLGFFGSPFGQIWTIFIILVIIIILVTVLNPGVWAGLVQAFPKKGRKWKT